MTFENRALSLLCVTFLVLLLLLSHRSLARGTRDYRQAAIIASAQRLPKGLKITTSRPLVVSTIVGNASVLEY